MAFDRWQEFEDEELVVASLLGEIAAFDVLFVPPRGPYPVEPALLPPMPVEEALLLLFPPPELPDPEFPPFVLGEPVERSCRLTSARSFVQVRRVFCHVFFIPRPRSSGDRALVS